ncbi:MAG: hypothetical protein JO023_19020 [Chloroflexi bacterium]|nr:hypothetical protein [Chloroflexota bacterium]
MRWHTYERIAAALMETEAQSWGLADTARIDQWRREGGGHGRQRSDWAVNPRLADALG